MASAHEFFAQRASEVRTQEQVLREMHAAEQQARTEALGAIVEKVRRIGEMAVWMVPHMKSAPDVAVSLRRGWSLRHVDPYTKTVDDGQSPLSPTWNVDIEGGGVALMQDKGSLLLYKGSKANASAITYQQGKRSVEAIVGIDMLDMPPETHTPGIITVDQERFKEEVGRPDLLTTQDRSTYAAAQYYEDLLLGLAMREGIL